MVATPAKPQRLTVGRWVVKRSVSEVSFYLQARDSPGDSEPNGQWGPMQIAAPLIVGGALLCIFAVYIIWQRRPRNRAYDYLPVRSGWVARIFPSGRTRRRPCRSSVPMTLDDSMRTSAMPRDYRRSRQYRSGSSDSQTPLTTTSYDYPPNLKLLDDPPSVPKRRTFRWWWIFGSRPQEIKSEDPGSRWRVDGPDGSSTGHGHSNRDVEEYRPRYIGGPQTIREDPEDANDPVSRVGETFLPNIICLTSSPTPMQARPAAALAPENPASFVARTPVPAVSNLPVQSSSGTPILPHYQASPASRGLPPSYDVSQSQTLARYPSAEEVVRLARAASTVPVIPPPPRTAMYNPSVHGFHGRELSSESFLAATQPPMAVATTLY